MIAWGLGYVTPVNLHVLKHFHFGSKKEIFNVSSAVSGAGCGPSQLFHGSSQAVYQCGQEIQKETDVHEG
jgi:hypothetical protein